MRVILISFVLFCVAIAVHGGAISPIKERAGACSLAVTGSLGEPQPLIITPGTTNFKRTADTKGTLSFEANEAVLLACPGTGNYLTVAGSGVQEVTATCSENEYFVVNSVKYAFSALKCNKYPVHVQRLAGSCLSGKTLIEIGFVVSTGFMKLINACHDTTLHHTYYTQFTLTKDAAASQTGIDRPDWYPGDFFSGIDPTELYKRATQRVTFTTLLGSSALAEEYIHLTNDYFLSKGHLVAKADFLYGAQQMTTFWYSNAAPQWQTFNGNNWNSLENDCRAFAGRSNADLTVYTGTYGRASLPDINNNEVDLYLSVGGTAQRMPVPRMFWKVLYNPTTQAGIAFIGLNNPYQAESTIPADIRCTDICSQISWLSWTQKDVKKGYSYCCEVNNFRANFPDIPSFTVTSILK